MGGCPVNGMEGLAASGYAVQGDNGDSTGRVYCLLSFQLARSIGRSCVGVCESDWAKQICTMNVVGGDEGL